MVCRGLIAAVALVLATGTFARAAEPVPEAAVPEVVVPVVVTGPGQCSLGDRSITQSVKPLYSYEDSGYTAFRQFRGAEVFVPAQPGLTAEWIDRVLTTQAAAGVCNFGVSKVDIDVLSDGGGFSVRLSSHDGKGAAEILRRTQLMLNEASPAR